MIKAENLLLETRKLSKKKTCNHFNDYFVNIGPTLAKGIPCVEDKDCSTFLENSVTNSIYLNPVTPNEILDIVKHFKNKYSSGYDDLNMVTVKKSISCILQPLTYICNLSMETGLFPDNMKTAKVIPLFKAGDRKLISNFRPISILPQFSKILEKIIYNRLTLFIKHENIIYDGQYGFRENHSTTQALMQL